MEYFKKAPVFFFLFMLFAAPGSFTVERGAIHLPPVKFLSSDDSIPCFVSFTVSRQYSHSVDLRYGNGCSEQHKKENEKADIQYRINNYKTIGTGFQATGFAVELGGENNPPIDGNISYTRTTNIVNNCCPSGSSTEDLDANGSAGLTVNSDEGQVFLFQYDYESNFGMCSFSVHSLRNPNYKATIKQKDCSGQSSDNDISAMGEATIQALTLAGIQLNNSDNPLNAELEKVGIGGRCEFNKTESGYTIGFTSSRTTQNPIAEGWTGTDEITYVLHVDVGIKFKMKYTAYIEPEGGWDTYKQWLPEGNIKDTDRKAGNSTTFKIKIIDNEHPNEKVNVQVKELHYQLTDVSHVPGVCMNYPDKDPDQKADLSFIDPDNEQNTELADLTYKDLKPAYINSYDFGGSARLTAKITLFSGEELTAITSIDNKNYVNIPFRKDDSKVADYWKKKNHAEDLADNDDNEQSANGVGADYPGDGYTLYEEYRGFRENEKHISTSPAKKDILIFDNSEFKDRTQNGISLFAAVTGIVAHSHFKEDEFGKKEREPGQNEKAAEYETTGIEHNKILNVNNDASLHSVDQYGLLIVSTHKKLGYAKAVRKDKFPATPKGFFFLIISQDFNPNKENDQGWAYLRGDLDEDGNFTVNPNGTAKLITDEYGVTVAHEMLHCCHVRHHGDKDYTDGLIFLNNGVVSLYTKQTQVKPIILRRNDEAGTEIKATDEAFWNANPNGLAVGEVGLRGGQHSGVEDCIMRYDNAGAFLSADEGTVYIFEQTIDRDLHFKPNMWMNELTGLGLCDSKDGTGVNSSDASPRCRYGDATVGNCKSQVCINDKFD